MSRVGNKQYGIHLTPFRWGLVFHWEWKGNTYGGSWGF